MRQVASVFAIALSFFLFVSCSGSKETSKTQVTAEDVKRETRKVAQTAESYAQQQKEEYEKKVEAEIKELDRRSEDLKAQAEKAGAKSKAAIDKQMAALRKQQEIARQKLEELKAASASTWEETKKKVDTAIDELRRAYDRAASRPKS